MLTSDYVWVVFLKNEYSGFDLYGFESRKDAIEFSKDKKVFRYTRKVRFLKTTLVVEKKSKRFPEKIVDDYFEGVINPCNFI